MAKKTKVKLLPGQAELKNVKHELFCWLYSGYHNKNLFGNGTQSYMQAYGYNAKIITLEAEKEKIYNSKEEGKTSKIDGIKSQIKALENGARSSSSDLLAKPNIRARVDYLIDSYIDHSYTDRELQYVILQRFDLNSKVSAIKEYNRLKDRGSAGKLEGNFSFSWEGDDDLSKKKPTVKKMEVKVQPQKSAGIVDWEEDDS